MSSSASGSQKSWPLHGEVPMTRCLDCPRLHPLKCLTCVRWEGRMDTYASASSKTKGELVKAKRPRVDCDVVDDDTRRLYDRAPQVLEIALSTKEQLCLHYSLVDNVAVFSVSRNLFPASFCVAYALHNYLGDWSFKVADHFIKDEVVVKFDNLFSLNAVHGKNLKQGASSNNDAVMMATKVVELKPCKPDWFGLTKTQIIRPVTSSGSVSTVDAGAAEAAKPGASGSV
ncbi:hypothetical protein ZWY2020_010050 [Hordeum vulgare]|nr:hypothetical protein ZWY2020_010050 [Hordeum vulgare]